MIGAIQTSIRDLIYTHGHIDADAVDVRFARPSRQWVEGLLLPTINLYLFNMGENPDFRNRGPQVTRNERTATIKMPCIRVDLSFLVSTFSSALQDEQLLLWRVMAVCLHYAAMPAALLAPELQALETTLLTKIARDAESKQIFDLWKGLDLPPRPALIYTITVPLDVASTLETPLVLTRSTRFTRTPPEDEALGLGMMRDRAIEIAASLRIGGRLTNREGRPLAGVPITIEGRALAPAHTDGEGRFSLGPLQPGQLTLRVALPDAEDRLVPLTIPSEHYDIVVD